MYLRALGGARQQVLPGLDASRMREQLVLALHRAVKRYRKAARQCQDEPTSERVRLARKQGRRLVGAVELLDLLGFARHPKRLRRIVKRQIRPLGKVRDRDILRELIRKEAEAAPLTPAAAAVVAKLDRRLERKRRNQVRKAMRRLQFLNLKPIKGCIRRVAEQTVDPALVNRALAEAFAQAMRERPRPGRDPHPSRKALKRYRAQVRPLQDLLPPDQADEVRPRVTQSLGDLHDHDVLLAEWQKWIGRDPARKESAFAVTELFRRERGRLRREVESLPGFGG